MGSQWCGRALNALVLGGSGLFVAQAYADAVAGAQLEEITVTARKRAENIQDAPMSIAVLTADDLARLGASSLNDVALRTPGLVYTNWGDAKLSPTSLRGITADAGSAGADPAVGYYIDEVFIGQGAGASFDLYDIDRIEVLRGPQGTLFGRNSIGGVISISTKHPTEPLAADAELEIGDYNHIRVGASLNGALIPGLLAGRLSVVSDKRDGYSYDVPLNQRVNNQNGRSIRGQLLFSGSSDTSLLLSAEYRELDQVDQVFGTLSYNNAQVLPQLLDALGYPRITDPYNRLVYTDILPKETLYLGRFSATLKTDVAGAQLTSITAYNTHNYYSLNDTDRSQVAFLTDGDPEKAHNFSEEVRVGWRTGAVESLVGAYYFDQRSNNLSYIDLGADLASALGDPSLAGTRTGSDGAMHTQSSAVFASVSWAASDLWELTAGGRYTHEKKSIQYVQVDPIALLGGNANIVASDSWTQFTPNASLRLHFSPGIMGYATISKGFKSGGYNDALGSADGIAFNPETLWNYEIGLKSESADRRIEANLALFTMKWKDIQLTEVNPNSPTYAPTILNAGRAHSTGLEADLRVAASSRLRLGLSGTVLDAKYDEGNTIDGKPLDRIPYAARYSVSSNAEYRVPLGAPGSIALTGEYLVRGDSFLSDDNQPDGHVGGYGLANARLEFASSDDRWSIAAWVKNLTDKAYKQRLFDLSGQVVGEKFIAISDPRTYGVTFRIKY